MSHVIMPGVLLVGKRKYIPLRYVTSYTSVLYHFLDETEQLARLFNHAELLTSRKSLFWMVMEQDKENITLQKIEKFTFSLEGRVLEVGCGDGKITSLLAEKARNVTAIERCEFVMETREIFCTLWTFDNFRELYEYYFNYYQLNFQESIVDELRTILGEQETDSPLILSDESVIYTLRKM